MNEDLTDGERKRVDRFNAAMDRLMIRDRDHIVHDYQFSNGEIQTLAILCMEEGIRREGTDAIYLSLVSCSFYWSSKSLK